MPGLREHRRARRRGHDGRHLGDGRLLRADRQERAPRRAASGIGGVLEPPGARPVIIEDGAFVGSRASSSRACTSSEEAVLGADVVLTASTAILDVTGAEAVELKGRVPARSVVIPGTRTKKFPAGELPASRARSSSGRRSAATDRKVSLNEALRDFAVPV